MRNLFTGKRKREGKVAMQAVSKYYFFEERTKARVKTGRPFHDIVESKEAYDILMGMTFRYFGKHLEPGPDLNKRLAKWGWDIGRLFKNFGIPSQFAFGEAYHLYERHNVNGKVFDYACGWGNRLLAALCNKLDYTGVDTNPRLVEKLNECGRDFNSTMGFDLKVDVRTQPSEILQEEWKNQFGLCMSSPPYFDVEIYNGDNTSTTKYPEYNAWLEGYMRPTIANCKEYLIPGGKFILNIKNMGKLKMYDDAMRICKETGLEFTCEEDLHVTRRTGASSTKT